MSGSRKQQTKQSPGNDKEWAADAFSALEQAVIAFEQDYPDPDEEERLEIVGYAAEIAAKARGITDPEKIEAADEYAVDNVLLDLEMTAGNNDSEPGDAQPDYAILFLLCYLDVHVHWGLLRENRIEPVIQVLISDYDLSIR